MDFVEGQMGYFNVFQNLADLSRKGLKVRREDVGTSR